MKYSNTTGWVYLMTIHLLMLGHLLGLGHKTMVCAVCLFVFLQVINTPQDDQNSCYKGHSVHFQ